MKSVWFCIITGCGLSWASAAAYREVFTFTTVAGSPTTIAASVDGTNGNAKFLGPTGAALNSATNLYLADGNAIRRVAPVGTNWVVTTLAGAAAVHGYADGSNSTARFDNPQGVAVDGAGNLYVADAYNNMIRKVTPIGTNWAVTTLAGAGRFFPGTNDGTNASARFDTPYGVAVDGAGNVYVADTYNNAIRKVTPVGTNWVVTTLAGLAGTNTSGSANGTNGNARFSLPAALAVDSVTNLFVAETTNTIRKVTPIGANWVVTTVAGLAGSAGSANGTNTNARFNAPAGIAVDSASNLWVTDAGNNTIRKIQPAGTNWVVSTVAGAEFAYPDGIAVDRGGRLNVADQGDASGNTAIRLGQLAIVLQYNVAANQLTLSWPLAGSNYVLETTNKVTSTSASAWLRLTNGILSSGGGYSLTTNIGSPPAYFRLHKP